MKITIEGCELLFRKGDSKPPIYHCIGMTNQTIKREFVLFADYDCCNQKVVEDDLQFLQENYAAGHGIIIASSHELESNLKGVQYGNYHLVMPKLYSFPDMIEILKLLRCDRHFKYGWKYQSRNHVLRITPKFDKDNNEIKPAPTLVSFIPDPSNTSSIRYSLGHCLLMNKLHNLNIQPKEHDNCQEANLIEYQTR